MTGRALRPLAAAAALCLAAAQPAMAAELDAMTGCWLSDDFHPTSLLADATRPGSAQLLHEKMLLRFERIDGTDHLAFGRIYEWDEAQSYVLGPTYQNGLLDPAGGVLTFGFPGGGLDLVTMPAADTLFYVHRKAAAKSAMSVRRLQRMDCGQADALEAGLRDRQKALR